jgi:hypothetical protein
MKKIARIVNLIFIVLLSSAAYADTSADTKKIAYLLKKEKNVSWDAENIISADVAWNSKTDVIVGGKTENEFVLAIVNGANIKKYHIIKFDNVSSFCVPSEAKISIGLNSPYPEGIDKTKYYATYKKYDISVGDDSCDPNIISWNKKKRYFELFRN